MFQTLQLSGAVPQVEKPLLVATVHNDQQFRNSFINVDGDGDDLRLLESAYAGFAEEQLLEECDDGWRLLLDGFEEAD